MVPLDVTAVIRLGVLVQGRGRDGAKYRHQRNLQILSGHLKQLSV